tara:strand:- start:798 stop:1046 length:249 start_codon:yes stop_codon:yes gene_type:complete
LTATYPPTQQKNHHRIAATGIFELACPRASGQSAIAWILSHAGTLAHRPMFRHAIVPHATQNKKMDDVDKGKQRFLTDCTLI